MRSQSEKIVKSSVEWRKQNQVKKLRLIMTVVTVFLCISVAAGAILAWLQMKGATEKAKQAAAKYTAVVSSNSDSLPVYDNNFNLILVNSTNPIPAGYKIGLADCNGIPLEEKIVPALDKMMKAAQAAGCPLKLSSGYVDSKKQDQLYQAEVKRLMTTQKKSQVLAENAAQASVGRGGYSENQTGLAVTFTADGIKSGQDFSTTAQYRWLVQNSVVYGFILRYPENKKTETGCGFNPSHFRYVGSDNAVKMREFSMCLEEYIDYLSNQQN
ncbi:MAG TPA: M15 family metallopeptidase [Caproicibacter sp.]|nr:M15 family metallopeptidase [Caproicibacter sp.]